MTKPTHSEASERRKSNRIAKSRVVLVELGVMLFMIAVPTTASLVCLLFWGSEFQNLDRDVHGLPQQTATTFDISTLHSMVLRIRFVPIVLYVMWRSGDGWSHFGLVKPKYWKDVLIGLCLWLIVATLDFLIALAFRGHARLFLSFPTVIPLVRVVLLAGESCAIGFSEELVMRAYLIPRFEAITGAAWTSILLSVLVFGFVHIYQGYVGVIQSLVAAGVWGIAFCLTRRIWPVAISHAITDFVIRADLGATIGM